MNSLHPEVQAAEDALALLTEPAIRPWHGVRRLRSREWGLTESGRWFFFLLIVWLPLAFAMMVAVPAAASDIWHLYPDPVVALMAAAFACLLAAFANLAGLRRPFFRFAQRDIILTLDAERLLIEERALPFRAALAELIRGHASAVAPLSLTRELRRSEAGLLRLAFRSARPAWQVAGRLDCLDRAGAVKLTLTDRWVPNNKEPNRQVSLAAWLGAWWPVAERREIVIARTARPWTVVDATERTQVRPRPPQGPTKAGYYAAAVMFLLALADCLLVAVLTAVVALCLLLWGLARRVAAGPTPREE